MKTLWTWFFLSASVMALSQRSVQASLDDTGVMLAAVSRYDYMLMGGISAGGLTANGTAVVEPLARLTLSGKWQSLPCDRYHPSTCRKFEREYLSKPHAYTVVSADGYSATVRAAPTTLSECYDFTGRGTYLGANIARSAIAASSIDFFTDSPPPQLLGNAESKPILRALASLVPKRLDSTLYLRLFSLQLEGRKLVLIQRAFADYPDKLQLEGPIKLIFAIGTMEQGRFQVLHWKQNVEDEDERVLGTVQLKSGRAFLITSVSDPESQKFRVYGIQDGKLAMIYYGGGASC